MCIAMAEIKANFLHVRPSVRMHQHDNLPYNYTLEIHVNISKDLNLLKIVRKYETLLIKTTYISLLTSTLIIVKTLFAMEVVLFMLCCLKIRNISLSRQNVTPYTNCLTFLRMIER